MAAERLAPPVREADDPEYAANLRRATLANLPDALHEVQDADVQTVDVTR